MKRIKKDNNSEIVKQNLKYPTHAKKIRGILEKEQNGFCAYTEYRITSGFAVDVEHFNPKLKPTDGDGYNNWFAVSHKWNNKKAQKWDNNQPVLHPTDEKFEDRIIYEKDTACYIYKDNDNEAKNLILLLDLNNENLVKERLNKILLLKDLFGETNTKKSFQEWISHSNSKKELIDFRRAIETVFNINL